MGNGICRIFDCSHSHFGMRDHARMIATRHVVDFRLRTRCEFIQNIGWYDFVGVADDVPRRDRLPTGSRWLNPDTGQFTRWERESGFQALGAISGAVTPNLFVGAEVRYLAAYEGSFLNQLEGRALYVGPTLYARLAPKSTITLAYSWQVAGKATGEPGQTLDLLNFERQQFRVRWVYEF